MNNISTSIQDDTTYKNCKTCNRDKPLSEFYETIKKRGNYYSLNCKECARVISRSRLKIWYQANKEKIKENAKARSKAWRLKNKNLIQEYNERNRGLIIDETGCKTCKKCGLEKLITDFYKCSYRTTRRNKCKICCTEESIIRGKLHPPKKSAEAQTRNYECYYRKNKDGINTKSKRRMHASRISLSDSYIRSLIRQQTGIKAKDVTIEQTELKKNNIKLKRKIYELQRKIKSQ